MNEREIAFAADDAELGGSLVRKLTRRRCRYRVEPLHVEISDVDAGAGLTSLFPTAFFGASRWKAARRKCRWHGACARS
jgi:hypothetical protein